MSDGLMLSAIDGPIARLTLNDPDLEFRESGTDLEQHPSSPLRLAQGFAGQAPHRSRDLYRRSQSSLREIIAEAQKSESTG